MFANQMRGDGRAAAAAGPRGFTGGPLRSTVQFAGDNGKIEGLHDCWYDYC